MPARGIRKYFARGAVQPIVAQRPRLGRNAGSGRGFRAITDGPAVKARHEARPKPGIRCDLWQRAGPMPAAMPGDCVSTRQSRASSLVRATIVDPEFARHPAPRAGQHRIERQRHILLWDALSGAGDGRRGPHTAAGPIPPGDRPRLDADFARKGHIERDVAQLFELGRQRRRYGQVHPVNIVHQDFHRADCRARLTWNSCLSV